RRAHRTRRPSSRPAVGRRAPTGRDRARHGDAPARASRRRAHRQPRQPLRRADPRAARRAPCRGPDARRRDARPGRGQARRARGRHARQLRRAAPPTRGAVVSVADLLAFATTAIRGHRVRTGLTLTGVAIGVAAVIVLTALGEGARRYVMGQFESLGSTMLAVIPGRTETTGGAAFISVTTRDLTLADAQAL